jgi:O-antigen/teichoic acid export membrane protein
MFIKEFFDKLRYSKGSDGVLVRGALGAFVVKTVGVGLLFGLHVLLARLLGVAEYGIYIYAIAWINILMILCLMGFQTSLVRFISAYRANQQWGLLRGLLRFSNFLVFAVSLSAAMAGVIFIRFLGDRINSEQARTFYAAFLILPILALVKLREAGLQALKHVVQSQLLIRVLRPLILAVISIGLFLLVRGHFTALSVVMGNIAAVVVVFGVGSIWLSKSLPGDIRSCTAVYEQREWLKVSLPLLFIVGMSLVLKRTDIIMIGAIRGPEDAGIYSAATNISNFLVFGLMAFNSILAPMISEFYHTGGKKELQRIIKLAARGIFVFTVLVGILLIVLGKSLLSFFGEAFVVAYVPLLVLLSSRIVISLAGPVSLLMTMTDHQNQAGIIVAVGAVLNIILNALLIPAMGLPGAAIATATSLALSNIAMLTYIWRKMEINPTIINKDFSN